MSMEYSNAYANDRPSWTVARSPLRATPIKPYGAAIKDP